MIKFIDNIKKSIQENIDKIFDFYIMILIVSIILFSRNTMITTCIIGFKISFFISLILFIPLFIIALRKIIQGKINFEGIITVLVVLVAIVLSVIIKKDWQLYNISILYYIVSAIALILVVDVQKIKKYYINTIFVIAIYSLFTTYLIKPLIFNLRIDKNIENTFLIFTNSANYNFLNLGLGVALFDKSYNRNYGLFSEPSFFQFYLVIATMLLLFLDKKDKLQWLQIAIFIVTVYTTKSAAGIIVLVLIIATYLLRYILKNKNNYKRIFKVIIAVLIICFILSFVPSVRTSLNVIYWKFTEQNESFTSRFGSIEYTIKNFIKSPIIGNEISGILEYENDLTNTIFTIGAVYGLVPFLCLIYFTIKFAMKFKQKKFITFCIFIIIMLASNSHVFIGIHSFWMLILLGFKGDKIEN